MSDNYTDDPNHAQFVASIARQARAIADDVTRAELDGERAPNDETAQDERQARFNAAAARIMALSDKSQDRDFER